MDYKKLVEQLRSASPFHGSWMRNRMTEAADAIEALLAERDAAVEDLRGQCDKCEYFNRGEHDFPCCHCFVTGGMSDYWKWRGLRKESLIDG